MNACALLKGGDKGREWVRRIAALLACMLLDQGTKDALDEAKETLEGLMTEEYPIEDPANAAQTEELPLGKHERTVSDSEIDNRVLVYSLLGMLKKSLGNTQ